MIEITGEYKKCFADKIGTCCATLYHVGRMCQGCHFYKPKGCENMIRVEKGDRVFLYTLEERKKELYGS